MSLALLADAPCSDCGALLEQGQRYCVHCGRRRQDVEDPAIAWLASSATPAQRTGQSSYVTAAAAAPPPRNSLALPALALAILPLAVGVGVLIGHHGDKGASDQQLLDALRNQKAPVVKVGGAVAGTAVASHTAATHAKKAVAAHHAKVGKKDKSGAKVVARTKYGVAHQITGFKPTAAKVQSDKKLVQKINKSIGKNYLQAQRNLPDTIVVTGGGGGSSPTAQGRGD
jgi:hypothetical protein